MEGGGEGVKWKLKLRHSQNVGHEGLINEIYDYHFGIFQGKKPAVPFFDISIFQEFEASIFFTATAEISNAYSPEPLLFMDGSQAVLRLTFIVSMLKICIGSFVYVMSLCCCAALSDAIDGKTIKDAAMTRQASQLSMRPLRSRGLSVENVDAIEMRIQMPERITDKEISLDFDDIQNRELWSATL
jgi:hypothetical protein